MALSQSAALHDVASRRAASRALTVTHPLGSERRGSRRPAGPCTVECLLPWRHVPHTHGPQCRRTGVAPPNQPRAGVHAARRRRPFAPYLGHAMTHAPTWFPRCARKPPRTALPMAIKPSSPSSRGRRAAAARHGCLTVNSTPACFSSPTRAASHSFRTPCSSCARLLVFSSRQLAGVVLPRPPPSSRRRAQLPARSLSQPTASVLSLGPREATRATRWPAPPVLTGIRAPAAAPPPVRRHRRSPATPPVNPPPPIDHG
jgi:hypothetical protein